MRILFADDEIAMTDAIKDIFTFHKHNIDCVNDGEDALYYATNNSYDVIILDIMMPKKNGIEVLKEIRRAKITTPILLLTAKSEVEDKVFGLDSGADDYLTKPFSSKELLSRVNALSRRSKEYLEDNIKIANITLDRINCTITNGENIFSLSKTEFSILEVLMINKDIYFSSDRLIEKVWGNENPADNSTLWVYLSNIRKKLTSLNANIEIKVKRGIGYAVEEVCNG